MSFLLLNVIVDWRDRNFLHALTLSLAQKIGSVGWTFELAYALDMSHLGDWGKLSLKLFRFKFLNPILLSPLLKPLLHRLKLCLQGQNLVLLRQYSIPHCLLIYSFLLLRFLDFFLQFLEVLHRVILNFFAKNRFFPFFKALNFLFFADLGRKFPGFVL